MKIKAVLLALICSAHVNLPATAEDEVDASKFVLDYYKAKAASKSLYDTSEFLSAGLRAKQKPGNEKMNAAIKEMFGKLMSAQEVKTVRVSAAKVESNKATIELDPVDIPQSYKDRIKGVSSWSLKGSVNLVKEGTAWKVDKDMWTFLTKTKQGKFEESFGITNEADPPLSSLPMKSVLPPATDFEGRVRDKMMTVWSGTGTGSSIYCLITLGADGKIVGLKVRGEKPQLAAEQQVVTALVKSQPFQPLPAKYKTQRNVWMNFDWHDGAKSVSGPYFSSEPHPEWLRQKVGLK